MEATVFRTKLFEAFQSSGIEDSLKSQLRLQLIQFIRKKSGIDPISVPSESIVDLWTQIANSIVVDLLQICQYNYSLSVFLPEASISMSTVDRAYILQLLNSRNHSYQSLHFSPQVPILVSLLKFFSFPKLQQASAEVQTEPYRETLDKKLKNVDSEFSNRTEAEGSSRNIEERLIKFQREFEDKCRKEMEENVRNSFKDFHLN
jgi:hypothetical protein